MRRLRFREGVLMATAGIAALLIWGAIMGFRSRDYYRRATQYSTYEHAWREIAARRRGQTEYGAQCAEYYAQLAQKYQRAMWQPWMPVGPDPAAPEPPPSQKK